MSIYFVFTMFIGLVVFACVFGTYTDNLKRQREIEDREIGAKEWDAGYKEGYAACMRDYGLNRYEPDPDCDA